MPYPLADIKKSSSMIKYRVMVTNQFTSVSPPPGITQEKLTQRIEKSSAKASLPAHHIRFSLTKSMLLLSIS